MKTIKYAINLIILISLTSISSANNKTPFNSFKKPKIRALLIANQDYKTPIYNLKYPINDMLLYKSLFSKILNTHQITIKKNLTSNNFKDVLKTFIKSVKQDELIFIIYSGHGNIDGAPWMVDEKTINKKELQDIMNSFNNDTIFIMDSCYSSAGDSQNEDDNDLSTLRERSARKVITNTKQLSGNDLSDKEINEKISYRKNILRIYSSLAHQKSKEGDFLNIPAYKEVFSNTKSFLNQIGYSKRGNGIFTLTFASFFADLFTQKSLRGERFDFYDLYSALIYKTTQIMVKVNEHQIPTIRPSSLRKPMFNYTKNNYILYKSLEEDKIAKARWEGKMEGKYETALGFYNDKDYITSAKLFQKIIHYKYSRIMLSNSYEKLGEIEGKKQNYNKAMEYYKLALKNNPQSLSIINRLGLFYLKLYQFKESLFYYNQLLRISQKIKHQKWTGIAYNGIGVVYLLKEDFKESLNYYIKAYNIFEKILGKNHPYSATINMNIGQIYYKKGQYNIALNHYMNSLKIFENILGKNHYRTAINYSHIGLVYYKKKQYNTALDYYTRTKNIYEKILGKNHTRTAHIYNIIGLVYFDRQNYNTSLNYYEKSIKIYEKILGKNHPSTATMYLNIGLVYHKKGKYNIALNYFLNSKKTLENILGKNHYKTIACYRYIAHIYYKNGQTQYNKKQYNTALKYYLNAKKIYEKILGKNHPHKANIYNEIGVIYFRKTQYDKTLEYFNKSLKIYKKVYGEKNPYTATRIHAIGVVYFKKKQFSISLKFLIKAMEIYLYTYKKPHLNTAQIYYDIAHCYYHLKKFQISIDHLLKAIEIQEKLLGKSHPHTKSSYHLISNAYLKLGNKNKSEEYKKIAKSNKK